MGMIARNDDICRRHKAGETYRAIGEHYGISPARARQIVLRAEWLAKGLRVRQDWRNGWFVVHIATNQILYRAATQDEAYDWAMKK